MNKPDRFIAGTMLVNIGIGILVGLLLRYGIGLPATVATAVTLTGVAWAFSPARWEMDF